MLACDSPTAKTWLAGAAARPLNAAAAMPADEQPPPPAADDGGAPPRPGLFACDGLCGFEGTFEAVQAHETGCALLRPPAGLGAADQAADRAAEGAGAAAAAPPAAATSDVAPAPDAPPRPKRRTQRRHHRQAAARAAAAAAGPQAARADPRDEAAAASPLAAAAGAASTGAPETDGLEEGELAEAAGAAAATAAPPAAPGHVRHPLPANRQLVAAAAQPDATPAVIARLARSRAAAVASANGRLRADAAILAALDAATTDPQPALAETPRPNSLARRHLRRQQERALTAAAEAADAGGRQRGPRRAGGPPATAGLPTPPPAGAGASPDPTPTPPSGLWQGPGSVYENAVEQGRRDRTPAGATPPAALGPRADGGRGDNHGAEGANADGHRRAGNRRERLILTRGREGALDANEPQYDPTLPTGSGGTLDGAAARRSVNDNTRPGVPAAAATPAAMHGAQDGDAVPTAAASAPRACITTGHLPRDGGGDDDDTAPGRATPAPGRTVDAGSAGNAGDHEGGSDQGGVRAQPAPTRGRTGARGTDGPPRGRPPPAADYPAADGPGDVDNGANDRRGDAADAPTAKMTTRAAAAAQAAAARRDHAPRAVDAAATDAAPAPASADGPGAGAPAPGAVASDDARPADVDGTGSPPAARHDGRATAGRTAATDDPPRARAAARPGDPAPAGTGWRRLPRSPPPAAPAPPPAPTPALVADRLRRGAGAPGWRDIHPVLWPTAHSDTHPVLWTCATCRYTHSDIAPHCAVCATPRDADALRAARPVPAPRHRSEPTAATAPGEADRAAAEAARLQRIEAIAQIREGHVRGPWACKICTFTHSDAEAQLLWCRICSKPRIAGARPADQPPRTTPADPPAGAAGGAPPARARPARPGVRDQPRFHAGAPPPGARPAAGQAAGPARAHWKYPSYELQQTVLRDFYATHDRRRTADQIRAILDRRRGAAPALSAHAFNHMCAQLQAKYGTDPRSSAPPPDAPRRPRGTARARRRRPYRIQPAAAISQPAECGTCGVRPPHGTRTICGTCGAPPADAPAGRANRRRRGRRPSAIAADAATPSRARARAMVADVAPAPPRAASRNRAPRRRRAAGAPCAGDRPPDDAAPAARQCDDCLVAAATHGLPMVRNVGPAWCRACAPAHDGAVVWGWMMPVAPADRDGDAGATAGGAADTGRRAREADADGAGPGRAPAAPAAPPGAPHAAPAGGGLPDTDWGDFDEHMLADMTTPNPMPQHAAPTGPPRARRRCFRCDEPTHHWRHCPEAPPAHRGKLTPAAYHMALCDALLKGKHTLARSRHARSSILRRLDKAAAAADTSPSPEAARAHADTASAARRLLTEHARRAESTPLDSQPADDALASATVTAARLRAAATDSTVRAAVAQADTDTLSAAQDGAYDAVAARVRRNFTPPQDVAHSCRRYPQGTYTWCEATMAHQDHCAGCQQALDAHLQDALDAALAADETIRTAAQQTSDAAAALAALRAQEREALHAADRAETAVARRTADAIAPPAAWLPGTGARLRECVSRDGSVKPHLDTPEATRAAGMLFRARHQRVLQDVDRQNHAQLERGMLQRLDGWELRLADHTAKQARRRARSRQLQQEKHKAPPWALPAQLRRVAVAAASQQLGVPAPDRRGNRARAPRTEHTHRHDRRTAAAVMAPRDLRVAGYNMSRLSKIQLQMLDLLDIDIIGLTEVWSTAENLDDYRGINRLLVGDPPPGADPAGAVAARLTADAARALLAWGMVRGAQSRALWMQFLTAAGPINVIVAYVPPHYRKHPAQQTVLDAIRRYVHSCDASAPLILIGDFNAQLVRHTPVSGRWVLRKNHDGMAAAQIAASQRLHAFAADAGLWAANTGQAAFQPQRGFAATWKLPGLGSDGRTKMVTLDYTFVNQRAKGLLLKCCNLWAPSKLRWAAARFDHAMQLSTYRIHTKTIKSQPSMRGVKVIYRQLARRHTLETNFRRLIQASAAQTVAALARIRDHDPENEHVRCLAARKTDLDAMVERFLYDGMNKYGTDRLNGVAAGPDNFIKYICRCAGWLAWQKSLARVRFLATIESAVTVTYRALVAGLQAAHAPIAREAALAARDPSSLAGTEGAEPPRTMTRSHGLEWPAGAETLAILAERSQAAMDANITFRRVPTWQRNQLSKRLKASTLADSKAYIDAQVKELRRHRHDPAAFHKQWNSMEAHGRRHGAGGGRFFQGSDGDAARTLQEDAAKWANYQAGRYEATPEEKALPEWDPIKDTTIKCNSDGRVCHELCPGTDCHELCPGTACAGTCHELSDELANLVLDAAKEGKTPGLDQTPVTLFLCSPTARQYVVVLLQTMWKYETLPGKIINMVQIMIHKAGRTRNERKSFRPITLMNDIMKIFDLALYYKLGRETGTIRELLEGATAVCPSFLSGTQRAFRRNHSTLDLLIIQSLTYLRVRACDMLAVSVQTDLAGAFDTISHKMTDRALKAAGASDKSRSLFRMIYTSVKCQVRCRGAGGGEAYSAEYDQDRGGAQGSVLMPLLFVLLMHHVYLQCDTGHRAIYGTGEVQVERQMARCKMCQKLFPYWTYRAHDGHCRGCQIVHALPEGNQSDAEVSGATPGAVRRSMTRAAAAALRPQAATLPAPMAPMALTALLESRLHGRAPSGAPGPDRTLEELMSSAPMSALQQFLRSWGNLRVVATADHGAGDAHCQFDAVAQHVPGHSALSLRDATALWLQDHGRTPVRLLHQPHTVRLMDAAYADDDQGWRDYCARVGCETAAMRDDPMWGDSTTLIAMAVLLARPIRVWLTMPDGASWHAVYALDDLPPGMVADYVDVVHVMDRRYLAVRSRDTLEDAGATGYGGGTPSPPRRDAPAARPATAPAAAAAAGAAAPARPAARGPDGDVTGARPSKMQDVTRSPHRRQWSASTAPPASARRRSLWRGWKLGWQTESDSDEAAPGGSEDADDGAPDSHPCDPAHSDGPAPAPDAGGSALVLPDTHHAARDDTAAADPPQGKRPRTEYPRPAASQLPDVTAPPTLPDETAQPGRSLAAAPPLLHSAATPSLPTAGASDASTAAADLAVAVAACASLRYGGRPGDTHDAPPCKATQLAEVDQRSERHARSLAECDAGDSDAGMRPCEWCATRATPVDTRCTPQWNCLVCYRHLCANCANAVDVLPRPAAPATGAARRAIRNDGDLQADADLARDTAARYRPSADGRHMCDASSWGCPASCAVDGCDYTGDRLLTDLGFQFMDMPVSNVGLARRRRALSEYDERAAHLSREARWLPAEPGLLPRTAPAPPPPALTGPVCGAPSRLPDADTAPRGALCVPDGLPRPWTDGPAPTAPPTPPTDDADPSWWCWMCAATNPGNDTRCGTCTWLATDAATTCTTAADNARADAAPRQPNTYTALWEANQQAMWGAATRMRMDSRSGVTAERRPDATAGGTTDPADDADDDGAPGGGRRDAADGGTAADTEHGACDGVHGDGNSADGGTNDNSDDPRPADAAALDFDDAAHELDATNPLIEVREPDGDWRAARLYRRKGDPAAVVLWFGEDEFEGIDAAYAFARVYWPRYTYVLTDGAGDEVDWRPATGGPGYKKVDAGPATGGAAPPDAPMHAPGLNIPLYTALWRQQTEPARRTTTGTADTGAHPPAPGARPRGPPPPAPHWHASATDTTGALAEAISLLRAQEAMQRNLEMLRASLDPARDRFDPALDAHATPLPAENAIVAYAASRGWVHLATITDPAPARRAMAQHDYAIHNELLAPRSRRRGPGADAPCFVLLNAADGLCDGPSWTAVARVCGWIHVLEPACHLRSASGRARESFGRNHNSGLVDLVLAGLRAAAADQTRHSRRDREMRRNMSDYATCDVGFRQAGRQWSAAAILCSIHELQRRSEWPAWTDAAVAAAPPSHGVTPPRRPARRPRAASASARSRRRSVDPDAPDATQPTPHAAADTDDGASDEGGTPVVRLFLAPPQPTTLTTTGGPPHATEEAEVAYEFNEWMVATLASSGTMDSISPQRRDTERQHIQARVARRWAATAGRLTAPVPVPAASAIRADQERLRRLRLGRVTQQAAAHTAGPATHDVVANADIELTAAHDAETAKQAAVAAAQRAAAASNAAAAYRPHGAPDNPYETTEGLLAAADALRAACTDAGTAKSLTMDCLAIGVGGEVTTRAATNRTVDGTIRPGVTCAYSLMHDSASFVSADILNGYISLIMKRNAARRRDFPLDAPRIAIFSPEFYTSLTGVHAETLSADQAPEDMIDLVSSGDEDDPAAADRVPRAAGYDAGSPAMRKALRAAQTSRCLDMAALDTYQQFYFMVQMYGNHWAVVYVDLCNRKLAWLDSGMQYAQHTHDYNRARDHIDAQVTAPIRQFLDHLWAAGRHENGQLHPRPWGTVADPGTASTADWPRCSIWAHWLTYCSQRAATSQRHKDDRRITQDQPDPASGRVPARARGRLPVDTHMQVRNRGVPQQDTTDCGIMALLAIRTLAETRPVRDTFTPSQLWFIRNLGICYFPSLRPEHLRNCWQCRHYRARMALVRATMVVELDAGALFQLPRGRDESAAAMPPCTRSDPEGQPPGAMPHVQPERNATRDAAWRTAHDAQLAAARHTAAAWATFRAAAAAAKATGPRVERRPVTRPDPAAVPDDALRPRAVRRAAMDPGGAAEHTDTPPPARPAPGLARRATPARDTGGSPPTSPRAAAAREQRLDGYRRARLNLKRRAEDGDGEQADTSWAMWVCEPGEAATAPALPAPPARTAPRTGRDGLTAVQRHMRRMQDAAQLVVWSDDDAAAMLQAEEFMRDWFYGQDALVLRSFEYADDQKMFECMERIPYLRPLRFIQEQILAKQVTARLETFEKGAYELGGLVIEMAKCWVQWSQEPLVCPGAVTEAEVEALKPEYRCAGCHRPEVSQLGCWGHQNSCPYFQLIDEWRNDDCASGEWVVTKLLAVAGPPEHRFWKVQWAPVAGTPSTPDGASAPGGGDDTGGFSCGWEPQHHIAHCPKLQARFWKDHPHLKREHVAEVVDDDGAPVPRCGHCNHMGFRTEAEAVRHMRSCPYKPRARSRTSTSGVAVIAARKAAAQARWPTITVRGRDGKEYKLQNKLHLLYLGHLASADATTTTDMESRMRSSGAGFWRVQHLWRHPDISVRDKLRMFRRYLMKLVYAGHVTWFLDKDAQRKLNYWAGTKVKVITGRTTHEELGQRTVDVVMTLRYWRRRYLGDILRSHRNDLRKQELCPHVELVRKRNTPRYGGLLMDCPPYDSVAHLLEIAGYFPPVMLRAQRGTRDTDGGIANLRRRARGERNELAWRAADLALRPDYGADDADDDTDEEYDADTGDLIDDAEKNLLSAEEKREKAALEERNTVAAVHTAVVESAGMPTWIVYHDGGFTKAETTSDRSKQQQRRREALAAGKPLDNLGRPRTGPLEQAKAGWGYWTRYYNIAPGMQEPDPFPHAVSPLIFQDYSYGPVQLDDAQPDFSGCVDLSNNTGELSAIPQILVRMLRWRRWRQQAPEMARRGYECLPVGRPTSLVLVYDSQYTHDMCVSTKPARLNTTVVDLCRRLLEDAAVANIKVTWVKVRGHSDNTGNDEADKCATWGMNGTVKRVMRVARYVNDTMGRTAWRTDHDPTVLDAVSDVERHAPDPAPE